MPGLHVTYSNRFEGLVAPLSVALAAERGGWREALFHPATVVVPNRNVEAWLKFALAREGGALGNLAFPFLRNYLNGLTGRALGVPVLEQGQLHAALVALFQRKGELSGEAFEPVRAYLEAGGTTAEAHERRAFQLAGRVAEVFLEYGFSRHDLVSGWMAPEPKLQLSGDPRLAATERWQAPLWRKVYTLDGQRRRWLLDAWLDPKVKPDAARLPRTLHLFGVSYVAEAFLRILDKLSVHADVRIYTLNPCAEFWEDVAGAKGIRRDGFARRSARLGPQALHSAEDPFALTGELDPPALRAWGRPGREHIRLLNELTESDFEARFVDPLSGGDTLLHRLQHDMLWRKPVVPAAQREKSYDGDASISFLAAPGVRREAETVAAEIWNAVSRGASGGGGLPLRFHEIAVLVNSAGREASLAHLEAAFSRMGGIPFTVVDSAPGQASPAVEAVSMLLKIPLGRFSRPEMTALITHPNVAARFPLVDPAVWPALTEQLAIYFGADRSDLEGTYVRDDLFNWGQGLTRLALGAFMADSLSNGQRRAVHLNGADYLPFPVWGDGLEAAGSLTAWAGSLLADARFARQARMPLREWAAFFVTLARSYVLPAGGDDDDGLERAVAALDGVAENDLAGDDMGYRTAAEFALAALAGLDGRRGQYLAGGVAVSSFMPMRALPFRLIFVLGLGEGLFPAADEQNPLDLRLGRQRAGDVSRRAQDRYLFLETLLAARERIVYSWIARDAATGEALAPATPVQELQSLLRQGYLRQCADTGLVTLRPPLRRDDDENGWDREALFEAKARALREDLARHAGPGVSTGWPSVRELVSPALAERVDRLLGSDPLPEAQAALAQRKRTLTLGNLLKFLCCPLQGSAGLALGLREDELSVAGEEDEVIALDRLQETTLARQAFLGAGGVSEINTQYRARELAGELPTGVLGEAARGDLSKVLAQWRANTGPLGLGGLNWERAAVGSVEGGPGPVRRHPPLVFADLGLELQGLSEPLAWSDTGGGQLRSLVLRTRALKTENLFREFLRGALSGLLALAAGEWEQAGLTIILNAAVPVDAGEGGKYVGSLGVVSREEARTYLHDLAADLMAGFHHYLLPIEVAESLIPPFLAGEPVDAQAVLDDLLERGQGTSSDYGPIRNRDAFTAPPPEQVREILARRFSPFFALVPAPRGRG